MCSTTVYDSLARLRGAAHPGRRPGGGGGRGGGRGWGGGRGGGIPPKLMESLQNDPEFIMAMSKPSVANAVNKYLTTGDMSALMAEPDALKLFEKMRKKFNL